MFYTVAAAAKATGLSKSTVLEAIETGRITRTKDLFGEWAIEHSDLHRLCATVGEARAGIGGAQPRAAPDGVNLEVDIEDLIRDAGDGLRSLVEEGQHGPHERSQPLCPPPGLTPQAGLIRKPAHAESRSTAVGIFGSDSPLPTVLIAAALLTALGVGWIAGSSSFFLLGHAAPTSLDQVLKSSSPILGFGYESMGITSADSARNAKSGAQYSGKLAAATRLRRAQESQQAKFTGAVTAQPGKSLSRPVAVPETRPTTIEGWTVRDVVGGKAVLEGPSGIWTVTRGDTVPGVGTIDSIVRWGNRWIVATSSGLITTQ